VYDPNKMKPKMEKLGGIKRDQVDKKKEPEYEEVIRSILDEPDLGIKKINLP
jgi:hypothetical protein